MHLQANRVCLVGLAPAHPLVRLRLDVVRVVFNPALRECAVPSGRKKRGGGFVEASTLLATATTRDGREWPLHSALRANLVELNLRLEEEPALLTRKHATAGHLAVLSLQLKSVIEVTAGLLSEESYEQLCAARGLPPPACLDGWR